MSQYLNITVYSFVYLLMVILFFVYTIKNRLDILSVGMVCYVVYTMYCFLGYGISGYYRPKLSPTLYWLVFIQMAMLLAYTNRKRKCDGPKYLLIPKQNKEVNKKTAEENKRVTTAFGLYTAVIAFFALINILPLGFSGFAKGKANVWENTSVLYIVSLYGAFPSFVYGIYAKKKAIWIPAFLIECAIFFAGSRAFLATLIVLFLCHAGVSMWRKKQNNRSVFILGALAIGFLLVYRTIDTSVMAGSISDTIHTLSKPETWLKALEFNEPRVIIANYDYCITSGILLPFKDVVYRIIDVVPGMTNLFSIKLAYPEYFSDWLMAEVNGSAGVGGTFWGESYAMLGTVGVILFTALWMVWLRFANNHLDHHKPYSSFIVALATYHAWYINRLDFNRVGQSIKVMFLCFLIWSCFYLLLGGELQIGKKIRIKLCKPLRGIVRILWNKFGKIAVDYVSGIWMRVTAPARRIINQIKKRCNFAAMRKILPLAKKTWILIIAILHVIWNIISSPGKKCCRWLAKKSKPYLTKVHGKFIAPCRSFIGKLIAIIESILLVTVGGLAFSIGTGLQHLWKPVGRFLGKTFRIICNIFVNLCAVIEAKLVAAMCEKK